MAQFLDKLKVDIRQNGQTSSNIYELSSDFDHIYENKENNWWSLRDFLNEIKNFFSKPMFMLYSKDVPDEGSTIMECYVAESDNEDGLDSRILDRIN